MAEYPVSSDLWVDYTVYLDKTLKVCQELVISSLWPFFLSIVFSKFSFYGGFSFQNFYLICNMDFLVQVGKAITHAYSRATRSCPWTGDLWARYLLALERGSASEKEIYAVSLN